MSDPGSTSDSGPLIRNVSDTALWVAVYRAEESERPDALFRDPYARRLAGRRGEEIARTVSGGDRNAWAFVARTVLFDQLIREEVAAGADTVVNLAAGLDARPYRMDVPASLRWVEVDLPPLIAYKEEFLNGETPRCRLERVRLDLADVAGRRDLFARLGRESRRVLVVTEGLLVYLSPEEVGLLAQDLATPPSFARWACDLVSPGLLAWLQRGMGAMLREAGSPLRFAPPEGAAFFARFGWPPLAMHSMLGTAARLERVGLLLRLAAKLAPTAGPRGRRPWAGVGLLGRG